LKKERHEVSWQPNLTLENCRVKIEIFFNHWVLHENSIYSTNQKFGTILSRELMQQDKLQQSSQSRQLTYQCKYTALMAIKTSFSSFSFICSSLGVRRRLNTTYAIPKYDKWHCCPWHGETLLEVCIALATMPIKIDSICAGMAPTLSKSRNELIVILATFVLSSFCDFCCHLIHQDNL